MNSITSFIKNNSSLNYLGGLNYKRIILTLLFLIILLQNYKKNYKKIMKKIKKEELMKMYYSKTIDEVCEILHISRSTLFRYLKENNIEKKGRGANRKKKILITD